MTGIFNRSFTRREKLMLLALIAVLIVGLYFYAVHFPIVNRTREIESESEILDGQLAAAQVKAEEYGTMQAELDEIFSHPQDEISVMPPYSNIETLMRRLDEIFAGTVPDFSFGQASIQDTTAARTITFSCTARDYTAARALLKAVTSTGYRCLLNSFTFTPESGDLYTGAVRVNGTVTFYEHVTDATPAPAA